LLCHRREETKMLETAWRKRVLGVGMAAAAALAATSAQAAPEVTAAAAGAATPAAQNKVALVLGLASPWGELGVSYQRKVAPSLAIETGLGIGGTGAQLAVLPKLLVGSGDARLFVEAGPSVTLSDRAGAGVWATGEIGFEASFSAWTLGFGAGAGLLVAGEVAAPICFDACSTVKPGVWLPEIRLTIGRTF
jgi:hypothetical protein